MKEIDTKLCLEHRITYDRYNGGYGWTESIPSRDLEVIDFSRFPEDIIAFDLSDRWIGDVEGVTVQSERINKSPRYYIDGRNITIDQIKEEFPDLVFLYENFYDNGAAGIMRGDNVLTRVPKDSWIIDSKTRETVKVTE